jgi:DNA-binding transcriptional ArsR family regulator
MASLGTLGDPTRRLIFETLAAGPLSVGELAQRLPISRPAVSQHLRALKEAGLVVDRPDGTRRIYRVNPAGVAQLRAYLDQIWSDALAAFKSAVEAGSDREEPDERASTANKADTANRADTANEAESENKEES